MPITEKQLEGAVILVVFALIVCCSTYYFSSYQNKEYFIRNGDKSAGPMIVEIIGDTAYNGIYFMPEKSTVADVLKTAGNRDIGTPDKTILEMQLSTGKTIEIRSDGHLNIMEMSSTKRLLFDIPINLNKANTNDLILVPGIGKKTAEQIIQFRRVNGDFQRLEDLMKIRGIKEKKFVKLKKYFTITHNQ